MNWLSTLSDFVPVAIQGGMAAADAWRDRRKSPAEQLANKPRPLDAALVAMLKARKAQAGTGAGK